MGRGAVREGTADHEPTGDVRSLAIRSGTRLRNLGCEWNEGDRWCRVAHGSTAGWVQQQWLREAGAGGGGSGGPGSGQPSHRVTCESVSNRREYCRTDTSGGVRLVDRLSEWACEQNIDWGCDRKGIWVDHGCRAVFEVGSGRWHRWSSAPERNGLQAPEPEEYDRFVSTGEDGLTARDTGIDVAAPTVDLDPGHLNHLRVPPTTPHIDVLSSRSPGPVTGLSWSDAAGAVEYHHRRSNCASR